MARKDDRGDSWRVELQGDRPMGDLIKDLKKIVASERIDRTDHRLRWNLRDQTKRVVALTRSYNPGRDFTRSIPVDKTDHDIVLDEVMMKLVDLLDLQYRTIMKMAPACGPAHTPRWVLNEREST